MKIRPILRSDLIHIPILVEEWLKEQEVDLARIPYPFRDPNVSADYNFYLMNRIRERENCESRGLRYPWEAFVMIPQGNVAKGFAEVQIGQRFFQWPRVYCDMMMLFVEKKSRGRGFGNSLLREMVRWGNSFGVQAFELNYVPGSGSHKMWARSKARTYLMRGVFVEDNWKPITEEGGIKCLSSQVEAVRDKVSQLGPEDLQNGSMGIKEKKDQQDSIEMSSQEKVPLTLAKG